MRRRLRDLAVLAGSVVLIGGSALLLTPGASDAQLEQKAVVKLYSGDSLVGEWKATSFGRMEGGAFVFPVKVGVRDQEVRIHGTFSVETTN